MSKVSSEQIQAWTENPVTIELKNQVLFELERITETSPSEHLVRGEPQLSQENLIESLTKEFEWQTFAELLEGDWDVLEEEDDSYELETQDA